MSNTQIGRAIPESSWVPIVGPLVLAGAGAITAIGGLQLSSKCTTFGNNAVAAAKIRTRIVIATIFFFALALWSLIPTIRKGTEYVQARRAARKQRLAVANPGLSAQQMDETPMYSEEYNKAYTS
jgi:hypothetical protein